MGDGGVVKEVVDVEVGRVVVKGGWDLNWFDGVGGEGEEIVGESPPVYVAKTL